MSKKEILETFESLMYKHNFPAQVEIDLYHAYLGVKYGSEEKESLFEEDQSEIDAICIEYLLA